jgi:hypothetical protein
LRKPWKLFYKRVPLYVDHDFGELVRAIIIQRWNTSNIPLHTLAHALNPKFYDDDLIVESNGKRKALHKDRTVGNGVKKDLHVDFTCQT